MVLPGTGQLALQLHYRIYNSFRWSIEMLNPSSESGVSKTPLIDTTQSWAPLDIQKHFMQVVP